jgi:hydroxymethylpyrimidine pyrophosphatase-like HAD family hydrolase
MTSVVFEDNMLFFNGNIVLKNNNDNNENNLSLNEIEDFITKNIELNKENLLLKINHNNIYYNISFENDNISEIDFEFKSIKDTKNQVNNNDDNNNINSNKKIRIIKPRRKNESYEKEKIINRNIKIKKVSK